MSSWLSRVLGLDNPAGAYYLFWSGVGGDLSHLAIIGAIIGYWQNKTCDIKRCYRWAHYKVRDTDWTVCRRHSPRPSPTIADLERIVPEEELPSEV